MLLLIVDTAGPTGGVLLARGNLSGIGGDSAAQAMESMEILGVMDLHPRAFSAELIPAIAELLQANQWRLADVEAFAAVSGPGSFTGLRVGLSAVKAMAEVAGKPILTVSRLAIVASMADKFQISGPAGATVHAVLDAGRGEFYYGVYRDAGKTCVAESFATLDLLTESLRGQGGPVAVFEPAVTIALSSASGSRLCDVGPLSVRDALPLAVAAWQAGQFHDAAAVDANYLRRSNAVVVVRTKAEPIRRASQPEDSAS